MDLKMILNDQLIAFLTQEVQAFNGVYLRQKKVVYIVVYIDLMEYQDL